MIATAEFKKGMFIEMDNTPFRIMEFQHVKPGKGNAFIRTRLKNLVTGNVLEKTFKSGEKVGEPDLEEKRMQFLYADRDGFQFMDLSEYEQVVLREESVGDAKLFLTENLEIDALYYKGRPIALELPNFVELTITETDPGGKGDTTSGGGKPATFETGLTLSVPFHLKTGDRCKIDTRTPEYSEKLK